MFDDATLELQISEEIKNSQHTYAGQIIQYTQSFEFYHHDHQGTMLTWFLLILILFFVYT
jgi:hypothetical protein